MRRSGESELRRQLGLNGSSGPGELLRLLYGLGRQSASGVLTLTPMPSHDSTRAGVNRPDPPVDGKIRPLGKPPSHGRGEVFVLRRGAAVCGIGDPARRALSTRLARCVAEPALSVELDSVMAYPPGALHRVLLTGWVREFLEAQLDAGLADVVVRDLGHRRLAVRADRAPEPADEADRRMLAALAEPRRLDEIWPLARVPRFRLLAFLHFLRTVDALDVRIGAEARSADGRSNSEPRACAFSGPAPVLRDPRRRAALALLGVDDAADLPAVKRAYRQLARTLHPDLHPGADEPRRRLLEQRFVELTAAYETVAK